MRTCGDPRVARLIDAYEALTPERLQSLIDLYALDARFVDPFNDVTGHAAIRRIFEHMYATIDAPRFEVVDALAGAHQAFLVWNLHCGRRGRAAAEPIHGASHLRFGLDDRISIHRDYWDPARNLYERVPLLGMLMRGLRRRLSAG